MALARPLDASWPASTEEESLEAAFAKCFRRLAAGSKGKSGALEALRALELVQGKGKEIAVGCQKSCGSTCSCGEAIGLAGDMVGSMEIAQEYFPGARKQVGLLMKQASKQKPMRSFFHPVPKKK